MQIALRIGFWRTLYAYFKAMSEVPLYLPLILRVRRSAQTLPRRNESAAISDMAEQVANYDQVMDSKLAVFYAVGIRALYRVADLRGVKALDMAPGPGHFSLCMQRYLDLDSVTGVDMSQPMVETANRNASNAGLADRVKFKKGDITAIKTEKSKQFGLVTTTFAAHHLPDAECLKHTLTEMERLVRDDGLLMIMDLARLPSHAITEDFVSLAGRDYRRSGLEFFYRDFYESMFAAWTVNEMKLAVEQVSQREWVQLSMHGLPTLQILFGLPKNRNSDKLYFRHGVPWSKASHLLSPQLRPEWYLAEFLLAMGPRRKIQGTGQKWQQVG